MTKKIEIILLVVGLLTILPMLNQLIDIKSIPAITIGGVTFTFSFIKSTTAMLLLISLMFLSLSCAGIF